MFSFRPSEVLLFFRSLYYNIIMTVIYILIVFVSVAVFWLLPPVNSLLWQHFNIVQAACFYYDNTNL